MSSIDQAYEARIKAWIDVELSKRRMSFNELLGTLPGVYPALVANHVRGDRRIVTTGNPALHNYKEPQHPLRLPVPHPLDYDWRFIEGSRLLLLARARELTTETDRVVLLGAPTVFRTALESEFPRKITLIDGNPNLKALGELKEFASIIISDITVEDIPDISGQVVITDPPWYEEYSRAFLWAAARVTESGGTVLLSAPPVGTRPSIGEELARTVSFANQAGLRLISTEQVLKYRMPPFERNSLLAAGYCEVVHDWRPGVLVTFRRTADTCTLPKPTVRAERNDWIERVISGVRFRIRLKGPPLSVDPRLISIVNGDILDSVSRRDSRRAEVDVWTSGNRVFKCIGTHVLTSVLDAFLANSPTVAYVEQSLGRALSSEERDHINAAANHAIQIVGTEFEEYLKDWEG